ncbi:MAG: ABC transporter ATP-binding protein [Bacteroidales bacterium]|nr:ABC transporter ATP-binding protein [Bacteroidales bacterium]
MKIDKAKDTVTNTEIVRVENLTKFYKGRVEPAVDNLELIVNEGDFFGLLGPNGAGKTTTISMMCGLIPITKGKIEITGYDVQTNMSMIKWHIGVVAQDIALYDKLSAYENLNYFGTLYSIEKEILKKKITELLFRLGLEKFKDEKIKNFSGGMKRRVNLIAGLLHEPKLLFLDEPTVGVDVHSRSLIREYLTELNQNGTTIIYTSHMMEDAEILCSKVAIIDYGKVKCIDSPSNLMMQYECETLEKVFLKVTGHSPRD